MSLVVVLAALIGLCSHQFGSIGDKFDPHIHEALFEFPDPSKEPGTIGEIVKVGYMFKDRVLRRAQAGTVTA